jgi:hypothetical protein
MLQFGFNIVSFKHLFCRKPGRNYHHTIMKKPVAGMKQTIGIEFGAHMRVTRPENSDLKQRFVVYVNHLSAKYICRVVSQRWMR